MTNKNKKNFLFQEITTLKGVGSKIGKYLDKKKVEKIKDLLWDLPYSTIDRSKITNLSELEIGKITSVKVKVLKYNFPRIRNLPNRVSCLSSEKKIDCIFFNSYEGYIKKILPVNNEVIVFGKISIFKGRYQITNPKLVSETEDGKITDIKNYSLTDGLTISKYNKLINSVIENMPLLKEWHSKRILKYS